MNANNSVVGLNQEIHGNVNAFVSGFVSGDPCPDCLVYFRSKMQSGDVSYFAVVRIAENYRKHLALLRKASTTATKAKNNSK